MAANGRTLFEKLIYVGIATFFLWPFVQLWSIKAIPLVNSDTHLRASVALENLMESALERSYEASGYTEGFKPIPGYEDIQLNGKIEAVPQPDFPDCLLVRAQVKWGGFPFTKTISLEYLKSRTRP